MKNRIRAAAMILLAASIAAPAFAQSAGEATYKAKCQMCHGPDGTAATPVGKMMKVPSFKSPAAKAAPEASYIAITKDGKGKMPSYNGKLTDAQIREVVSYIRTLQK
jgi:cytochrome c6